MKFQAKVSFQFLSLFLMEFNLNNQVKATVNFLFNAFIGCGQYYLKSPNEFVTWNCNIKCISHHHVRFEIVGNLTKPLNDIWTHTVAYYKYTTYQKYAVDLWENMCGWLLGKSRSFVLDWTLDRMLKYTNFAHPCPYKGMVYLQHNNFSISTIPLVPLVPAGRYRLDINITDGSHKQIYLIGKLFFEVADDRIEVIQF